MLTSPKLSPAACFHNLPVEHALHNVSSSLDSLCPTLSKTQERLEFERTQKLLYTKNPHTGKCLLTSTFLFIHQIKL